MLAQALGHVQLELQGVDLVQSRSLHDPLLSLWSALALQLRLNLQMHMACRVVNQVDFGQRQHQMLPMCLLWVKLLQETPYHLGLNEVRPAPRCVGAVIARRVPRHLPVQKALRYTQGRGTAASSRRTMRSASTTVE